MDKHFTSIFHQNELKSRTLAKKNILPELVSRKITHDISTTQKLFKVAYYIALYNRPFSEFPKLISLLTDIGIDLGTPLHDRKTFTRIVQTIARVMRKSLVNYLNTSSGKITLIVDESTTISNVSCLIIYIKTTKNHQAVKFFLIWFRFKIRMQIMCSKQC